MNFNQLKNGFTAIEMLLVISILGGLFLLIEPQFSKIKELQVVKNTTGEIISSLNKARSDTLASLNSSAYGVHFQSNQVVIFTGSSYSSSASTNKIVTVSSPVRISGVVFGGVSASSGDVYFNRLTGTPSITGTITIASTNYSKIITLSATGIASSN